MNWALALLALVLGTAPPADSWPHFRGGPTQRGVAGGDLPAAMKELWVFTAADELRASAVVSRGTVYVGSGDGHLYAVKASDGTLVWRRGLGAPVEAPASIIGDLVVVGDLDGVVHAIEAKTGEPRWSHKTGDKIMGAPNHAGQTVVVGSYDGSLYGLDRVTGKQRWAYPTTNYLHSSPAVAGDNALVGGCDGKLHIVSITTGKAVRQIEIGAQIGSSIVVDPKGETAFLGHYGNQFVCIDTAAAAPLWRYQDRKFPFFSSAAVRGDLLVFGSRDKRVHAVHAESGELRWTYRTRGKVDGSPVIAGDKVVVASQDGRLHLLIAANGDMLWTYDLGAAVEASPAVASGRVFIGSTDGKLRAFGVAPPRKR